MFIARHERVSHTISIPLPASECLILFTPEGERHWVPDWEPIFLHPADGATVKGMVFLTSHGKDDTYWTVVDYDPAGGHILYSRLTPGSRSVLVEVRCSARGRSETEVKVTYALTGLTEDGNKYVGAFAGPAFPPMIEEWRTRILCYLQKKGNVSCRRM
jgi:hypothetical protein